MPSSVEAATVLQSERRGMVDSGDDAGAVTEMPNGA
jgi:hypothetical protein